MVHEWRVKHAYLQCTENTPRFRGIVDGEKRTEHICASNKFAIRSQVAATLPSPPQGSVHCEMLNLVLTFNSIRSLIRYASETSQAWTISLSSAVRSMVTSRTSALSSLSSSSIKSGMEGSVESCSETVCI